MAAALIGTAIGWGDELVQAILPNRVYDLRDVAMNAAGAVLGVRGAGGVPRGARQRRIVITKITASSRIMSAMKKPEKVRKPETLELTPPMSSLSASIACLTRAALDVEALHLVAHRLHLLLDARVLVPAAA